MGFSPIGLIVSVAVLAPNLLLLWWPPRPSLPRVGLPWPIAWLERAGQALCLVVPSITAFATISWWWTLPAAAAIVGYYVLWGRYLRLGRSGVQLYDRAWGVPVPMALLPVIAFAATSVALSNGWIALAAGVLAAGHIPASLVMARAIGADR